MIIEAVAEVSAERDLRTQALIGIRGLGKEEITEVRIEYPALEIHRYLGVLPR